MAFGISAISLNLNTPNAPNRYAAQYHGQILWIANSAIGIIDNGYSRSLYTTPSEYTGLTFDPPLQRISLFAVPIGDRAPGACGNPDTLI